MEIKQIKKGKKNTYCLLLDNHIEEIFYDDIIVKYSLIPKKKLTLIELQQIKQENNTLESYYQSIEYLTLRLRSKKEMKLYLEKKGYEKLTIQKTIEKLEKEGYRIIRNTQEWQDLEKLRNKDGKIRFLSFCPSKYGIDWEK